MKRFKCAVQLSRLAGRFAQAKVSLLRPTLAEFCPRTDLTDPSIRGHQEQPSGRNQDGLIRRGHAS
jgi:hypothetical protein